MKADDDYSDAITVTPVLDEQRASVAVIGPEGGTITASAEDGTTFELTIPAEALVESVEITMTPVTALTGIPFGEGTDVTVDLQPSGLQFYDPAILRIGAADVIPADQRIVYGYSESFLTLAEPVMGAEGVEIVVPHFSGYGVAKGYLGDVEEARARLGGSFEERLSSELRAAFAQATQDGSSDYEDALMPIFKDWERLILLPRLDAVFDTCATGRLALQSVAQYLRQLNLFGLETELSQSVEVLSFVEGVGDVCMQEEYEMCAESSIVHRIENAFCATMRQVELAGFDPTASEPRWRGLVEGCLTFELEFDESTTWNLILLPMTDMFFNERMVGEAQITYDVAARAFRSAELPTKSVTQDFAQRAAGCTGGETSMWETTGSVESLVFGGSPGSLATGGGGVTGITLTLDLPYTLVTISGLVCMGQVVPASADLVSSHFPFMSIHGGVISDWIVAEPGSEVFATATWSGSGAMSEYSEITDQGTAKLRHVPQ